MEKRKETHKTYADLKLCLQSTQHYEELLEKNNIEYKVNHFFFSKGELKGVMRGYKLITFNCDEEYPIKVFKINTPKIPAVSKDTVG